MRRKRFGLWLIPILAILAGDWLLSYSSVAESGQKGGRTLQRGYFYFSEGSLRFNPCLFLQKGDRCPGFRTQGPEAERILRNRLSRFDGQDARGSLMLSFSTKGLELDLGGVSGDEDWLLQWEPPIGP